MAQAKVELFQKDYQESAILFKALGHPARLAILQFLADTSSCFTGDISKELPLARTTINQHLTELKKAGLIHGHISGSKTNYCINIGVVNELKQQMKKILTDLNCCEALECA